jgi:hypothetical protein
MDMVGIEALCENNTLTSLSLEHNPLTSDGANFYGLETLCRSLCVNTTLTSLNLFACGLAAEVHNEPHVCSSLGLHSWVGARMVLAPASWRSRHRVG